MESHLHPERINAKKIRFYGVFTPTAYNSVPLLNQPMSATAQQLRKHLMKSALQPARLIHTAKTDAQGWQIACRKGKFPVVSSMGNLPHSIHAGSVLNSVNERY